MAGQAGHSSRFDSTFWVQHERRPTLLPADESKWSATVACRRVRRVAACRHGVVVGVPVWCGVVWVWVWGVLAFKDAPDHTIVKDTRFLFSWKGFLFPPQQEWQPRIPPPPPPRARPRPQVLSMKFSTRGYGMHKSSLAHPPLHPHPSRRHTKGKLQ